MPPLQWQRLAGTALRDSPQLQSSWDMLNAAGLNLPFLGASAVALAQEVFGTGEEILLVGRKGPEPAAMFVLAPDGALRWQTFQPSQMPLGCWVARQDLVLPGLCQQMLHQALGLALVLSVTQVDPLMAARPATLGCTRADDYIETAWVDIEGSFDAYWAARGKNLRQNMRKQRNKLAAEGTTTQLGILREPQDMAPALVRFGALESSGWKAGQGTAIHPDNAQGLFYRRLFEQAAGQGEALVFEYLLGGKTAAMNLCLLRGGVLVVLKTAYDESLPKALSPAFLLREEELQWLHGQGQVRRMEYYGRVMDWHTKLTECSRTLYHLTHYRWPWLMALAQRRRASATPGVPAPNAAPTSDAPA